MAQADYVLTDSSGFIFDAIHMNKRVILLSWPEMTSLLDGQQSFSTPDSADQRIRDVLPVAQDIQALRSALSDAFDWTALEAPLAEIRHHYCDAFMDGQAGQGPLKRSWHYLRKQIVSIQMLSYIVYRKNCLTNS